MSKRGIFTNSSGDTIIEVLISIVILSLVLTGAYVTSNASFKNIIDSQQRIQALDVAQNQVEDLRAYAATPRFASFVSSSSCFQLSSNPATNNVPVAYDNSPSGVCVSQGLYLSEITFVTTAPVVAGNHEYQITVTWPSINGAGNSQVVLYYRVAV